MPNSPDPTNTDPVYIAYLAARRRPPYGRYPGGSPAKRVRAAILNAEGTHCATCQSHTRLRLLATSGAAWDAAVASKGHTAMIGRVAGPRRLAQYAAAAASPRVRACCPRCLPAARLRRHLEALNAAAHGPRTSRFL